LTAVNRLFDEGQTMDNMVLSTPQEGAACTIAGSRQRVGSMRRRYAP